MSGAEWTLIDSKGETALTFTAFIDLDSRTESQVSEYPIEEGGFASYNKTESPRELRVTLGIQGDNTDLEQSLIRLEEYRKKALLLIVSTPSRLYKSMTLESYSYKRTQDENAGKLIVELVLKEIREVKTRVMTTITKPKNPTSASKEKTGMKQAEEPKKQYESAFHSGAGRVI